MCVKLFPNEYLFTNHHQMKLYILLLYLSLLTGCINIAPDEAWDGDDTRIWINEASGFNVESFWVKEKSANLDSTVLEYKQEFEKNIFNQIIQSKHFNQLAFYDSINANKSPKDSIKGIWIQKNDRFQFLQFKGNQYPMTIFVDTATNTVVTHTIKRVE